MDEYGLLLDDDLFFIESLEGEDDVQGSQS